MELLNQSAEYGLRALSVLARLPKGGLINAEDLAAQTGAPRPYVSKIMRRFVRGGLVEAQKGHNGGYRLARPAKRIHFCEALEALGALPNLDRCLFGFSCCDNNAPCPLHEHWGGIREVYRNWVDNSTLDSLATSGEIPDRLMHPSFDN